MKNYLVVVNGQIVYTCISDNPPVPPEGGIVVEMPEDFSPANLHQYYYKDGEIRFKGEGGQYQQFDIDTEIWVFDIEAFRLVKAKQIDTECKKAIYAGFECDALGQVYFYPTNDKDQVNMNASFSESLSPENPPDWTTRFWCQDSDDSWDYRVHTAIQIRKAGSAMKAHVTAQILKNAQLQAHILAATNQEQLEAITWSN